MKDFLAGIGSFFKGLGETLVALANSRKAVVTFVGICVESAGLIFPQYADVLSKVQPTVTALLALLVAAIAFEDSLRKPPSNLATAIAVKDSLADPSPAFAAAVALQDSVSKPSPAPAASYLDPGAG